MKIIVFFTTSLIIYLISSIWHPIFSQQDNVQTVGLEEKKNLINGILQEVSEDESRIIGNLNPDSIPSLPIGLSKDIGGKRYLIAIDSAQFLPEGAFFNAYFGYKLPNSDERLLFAAEHIQFNPRGVLGGNQARLVLIDSITVRIGPNISMFFEGNGQNYVSWDCNGFQSAQLKGKFLFKDNLIKPAAPTSTKYTVDFTAQVTDFNNMFFNVSMDPFKVNGLDDFTFNVTDASVDMSDVVNPSGAPLPQAVQSSFGNDPLLWRGFYLKNLTITLPEEISKNEGITTVQAQDMFIDNSGISGSFLATNVFASSQANMDGGWGFSLTKIGVQLTCNQLTGGNLEGQVEIPALDDNTLNYTAQFSKSQHSSQLNYLFSVNPDESVTLSAFGAASMELEPSSSIQVMNVENKFRPLLNINGSLTLGNENAKLGGIQFENLQIMHEAPYISGGNFGLTAGNNQNNSLAGFPISLSQIELGSHNGKPALSTLASINLSFSSAFTLSSEAGFTVVGKVNETPDPTKSSGYRKQFMYDQTMINTLSISCSTSVINLSGAVQFRNNDPVYGKGFFGGLNINIPNIIDSPITMAGTFGNVDNYRYWRVDAQVPVSINLGQFTITSLRGGVSQHMKYNKTNQEIIQEISGGQFNENNASQYIPNNSYGMSFLAGVGLKYAVKEEMFNGDVVFSITFNENGGLNNLQFAGLGYMLVKRSERQNSSTYVRGSIAMLYDNINNIFDAEFNVEANFENAITGQLNNKIYISPNLWYVHLNTPYNKANINLIGIAQIQAYLMAGQNLPPMPPPPPQVTNVLGNNGSFNSRDGGKIAGGDGFATGASIHVGFDFEKHLFGNIHGYAQAGAGLGFDITMYKYGPNTYCQNGPIDFGLKKWYLNGQLYAYIGISAGVKRIIEGEVKRDWTILSANIAALLQGKLPNPTYLYGSLGVQASIAGIINQTFTVEFELGEECNVVN